MTVQIIQIPVGPMDNFAYLVVDSSTQKAAIVDPGWEAETILARARELGVVVDKIILTHTHFDHVQELPAVATATGVPIWVHALEKDNLPDGVALPKVVQEGDQLPLGNVIINVLHTPGHSPGSVCFLVDGHLIAGDTLFVDAIGRTDLPGSDPAAMRKSLQRLAQLPDHVVIYPGHDYGATPTSTIGAQKKSNPYL